MGSKVLGPMLRVSRLTDSRDTDQKPWGGSSGKSSKVLLSMWWRSCSARNQDSERSNEMCQVAVVSFRGLVLMFVDQGEGFVSQSLS